METMENDFFENSIEGGEFKMNLKFQDVRGESE